eukprot:m.257456 g.257456  ORF g.257456 m.257456 type:complete len:398 (+) comp26592_c0_seq1:282-1475(+)
MFSQSQTVSVIGQVVGKAAARWCHAKPLRLRKVLVVKKTSRLEVERQAVAASREAPRGVAGPSPVTDADLEATLQRRGSAMGPMQARHEVHAHNLALLLDSLGAAGIQADVLRASEYKVAPPDLAGYDAVLSAGGDGTFIDAAAHVSGDTPVIGFNTDPERSVGRLCLAPSTDLNPAECLAELQDGRFRRFARRRIRVELADGDDGARELVPVRAMNDVYVAETDAHTTLNYTACIDGGPWAEHRNSGLLVCTGSGSTAWVYNETKVDAGHVAAILELATGRPWFPAEARRVAAAYNAALVFDPTEQRLKYTQLAPIVGFGGLGMGSKSWQGHIPASGVARTMVIRSTGWHGYIAVDSSTTNPFRDGRIATLSLPDEDVLQTIALTGTPTAGPSCPQ